MKTMADLLRSNFTYEEHKKILVQIHKAAGLTGLRKFFPTVYLAIED